MNTFGERLRAALKSAGMTQKQLAEELSVTQQSIQIACSPKAKGSKHAFKMAEILGINPGWLSHGVGELKLKSPNAAQRAEWILAMEEDKTTNDVLFFQMDEVAEMENSTSSILIACPAPHSKMTYATRVKDNTMTSQYGRSYPEDCIIFVDPERAKEAKNGDRVIALIDGENGQKIPTFKQYGDADGQRYLQSINPQYPIITKPFEVIGLVIGMWIPE